MALTCSLPQNRCEENFPCSTFQLSFAELPSGVTVEERERREERGEERRGERGGEMRGEGTEKGREEGEEGKKEVIQIN